MKRPSDPYRVPCPDCRAETFSRWRETKTHELRRKEAAKEAK